MEFGTAWAMMANPAMCNWRDRPKDSGLKMCGPFGMEHMPGNGIALRWHGKGSSGVLSRASMRPVALGKSI